MNLSLKDMDFINNIYNIEYQNKIIYSGLDKLELEDKINSKKYKKKLNVLKDYFEDEQKFLNYNIDYFIYMYPVIYEFASSVAFAAVKVFVIVSSSAPSYFTSAVNLLLSPLLTVTTTLCGVVS